MIILIYLSKVDSLKDNFQNEAFHSALGSEKNCQTYKSQTALEFNRYVSPLQYNRGIVSGIDDKFVRGDSECPGIV